MEINYVKYIDYGVGMRIGDNIYLNENLKKYPLLHYKILQHELNHTSDFSKKDILNDLSLNKDLGNQKLNYYKFILKYPKSLLMYLPILKVENKWVIDKLLLYFWLIVLLLGVIIF